MREIVAKKKFYLFASQNDALEEAIDYESVLKRKKAASSERAWNNRLVKLLELHRKGYAPKKVIALSADSGWTGLFEPRNENGKPQSRTSETTLQRHTREISEELSSLT